MKAPARRRDIPAATFSPLWLAALILVAPACSGTCPEPVVPPSSGQPASAGPRFPVLYLDMDGTLLNSEHSLQEASIRALADFQACGGRFGIATGRTLEQVRPFLDVIHPDLPLVLYNGAQVVDPEGRLVLFSSALSGELVPELLRVFGADERVAVILVQDAEQTLAYPASPEVEEIAALMHVTVARTCQAPEGCLAEGAEPLKVLVVTRDEQAQVVLEEHQAAIPSGLRAVVGHPSAVEIIAEAANKSAAIERVLDELGLSRDQVVVFGDSGNDLEMLSRFPVSVAMERCHPESCAAALLRAGSNDSDTIADVIDRLVMGPGCVPR